MLKDNGKLTVRMVSRYGNYPDYLQTEIEKLYSRDFETKFFVRNNANKSEFLFLEKLSKTITKKFREETTTSKDKNVCVLVFCYHGMLYCIQSDFKTYGTDFYTVPFAENDKWIIFTTDEVNLMLGLKDRFAITLNEDFVNQFAASI